MTGEEIASLDDMPPAARDALSLYTLEEIIRPFVYDDLQRGLLTQNQLARKYGTTIGRIRQMGRKMGFYKKYPRYS